MFQMKCRGVSVRFIHLSNVGLRRKADHDIQLLQLDIDRIIIFHKEYLHLML